MPKHVTVRQKLEGLGIDNPDHDEAIHEALDRLTGAEDKLRHLKMYFEEVIEDETSPGTLQTLRIMLDIATV